MEQKSEKIISTDEKDIWNLIERAQKGHIVQMIGMGNSMRPLLKSGRDFIALAAVKEDTVLKKNDVIFYYSHEGKYVLHRIYRVAGGGYYMNGDGNLRVEPLLKREHIYLKAVGFWRNGKYLSANSFLYRCYGRVWMQLLPFRGYLFEAYSKWKRLLRK